MTKSAMDYIRATMSGDRLDCILWCELTGSLCRPLTMNWADAVEESVALLRSCKP